MGSVLRRGLGPVVLRLAMKAARILGEAVAS